MKQILKIIFVIAIMVSCSESKKDPVDILNASMAKAMEINSASYKMINMVISGADTQFVNRQIFIKRNEMDSIVGLKVKIVDSDSSSLYYDGTDFVVLDNYSRKYIVPDSSVPASAVISTMLDIQALIIKKRDGKLAVKGQNNISYLGQTKIDGRLLNVVLFKNKDKGEIKYYFSNDDKFIRQVEMTNIKDSKIYAQYIQINELNINARIPDSVFSPNIPNAYERQIWK